jgi:hypothetical protein
VAINGDYGHWVLAVSMVEEERADKLLGEHSLQKTMMVIRCKAHVSHPFFGSYTTPYILSVHIHPTVITQALKTLNMRRARSDLSLLSHDCKKLEGLLFYV